MKLLLDTHIFLWLISSDHRFSNRFIEIIRNTDNDVYLSIVSIWEATVKYQLGKLPLPQSPEIYLPIHVFKTYPDWTIEILSPEQSQTKVTGNILHCLKHGSRLDWLIDPGDRSVLVYPPKQQPELLQEEQEILPVPDLVSGFQLTVGQLFGWLNL